MVTKPLENNLATVTNLDEIRSTSIEEYSVINLKFTWGTNMDSALVDCRDKVAFLSPYLPSDVEDSVFLRLDMTMFPVIIYGVTAGESYPQLYDILTDQVSPILKRRPGVALTQVLGAPSREIRVSLDPNRLAAHNLSTQKIVHAIRYENAETLMDVMTNSLKLDLLPGAGLDGIDAAAAILAQEKKLTPNEVELEKAAYRQYIAHNEQWRVE